MHFDTYMPTYPPLPLIHISTVFHTKSGQHLFFFFFNICTHIYLCIWASLVAQRLKHLPGMWETQVQSLGWEDPLEKEMAPHSSNLAWRILSITLLVYEMSAIVRQFEHSLALPFFGIGMKTDLFKSCGHC